VCVCVCVCACMHACVTVVHHVYADLMYFVALPFFFLPFFFFLSPSFFLVRARGRRYCSASCICRPYVVAFPTYV
jgi:hypothetical protein